MFQIGFSVSKINPYIRISIYKLVQAFASQYVYCCKKLELDMEKVNVNGGAIAIGHPLGATGYYLHQLVIPDNMQHVYKLIQFISMFRSTMCCDIVERDEAERERLPLWSNLNVHRYVLEFFSRLNWLNDYLDIMLMVHVKCKCNRHWYGSCSCF